MNKDYNIQFEAIGTKWVIDCLNVPDQLSEDSLIAKIKNRIDDYDKTYSRFRSDSIVSNIAKKEGVFNLPNDSRELFSIYEDLYKTTDGLFTPLIGSVLVDAGYDESYSFKASKINPPEKFSEVVEFDFPKLEVSKPVLLDFGAAGKGHLIDIIGQILKKEGINDFCIDAGGDILYVNESITPLRVGLEHPQNASQVIGVVEIINKSICASSGNRRTWGQFHHIINPATLKSPEDILSVWVISEETIVSDALATCLFLVPPSKLIDNYKFEYLILYPDYTFKKSPGFEGEIFIN